MKSRFFYLVMGILMASSSILADSALMSVEDDNVLASYNRRCNYIYNSWDCSHTRGCYWDRYQDRCVSDYDDGDGYGQCYEIHSPLACSNRSDCYWSTSRNRCVSNNGGGGHDSPRICYDIYSRWQCEQTYPCHWSHSFDRCVGPNDR